MKRRTQLALCTVALIVGVSTVAASAEMDQEPDDATHNADGPRISVTHEPSCSPAGEYDGFERGLSRDEVEAEQEWRRSQEGQDDLRKVGEYIQEREDLFIGSYIDDSALELVAIVDPAQFEVTPQVIDDLNDRAKSIPIRVQPGCNTLEDLRAVKDEIRNDHRFEIPDDATLSMRIDASQGVVSVVIEEGNDGYVDELRSEFSHLIVVDEVPEGSVRRTAGGRSADVQPHYGAAEISHTSLR